MRRCDHAEGCPGGQPGGLPPRPRRPRRRSPHRLGAGQQGQEGASRCLVTAVNSREGCAVWDAAGSACQGRSMRGSGWLPCPTQLGCTGRVGGLDSASRKLGGVCAPQCTAWVAVASLLCCICCMWCRRALLAACCRLTAPVSAAVQVVLAYSGGLDTSVILKWLQDSYECEVRAALRCAVPCFPVLC